MPRRLPAIALSLCLALAPLAAQAWNGAGHRLIAVIAWQQMSPDAREFVSASLARHPDHAYWVGKVRADDSMLVFAEAATWPDDIRDDARFFDEDRETPTPPLPGFPDTAKHKRWHYVDMDADGRPVKGELDRQLVRLLAQLDSCRPSQHAAYALPWIAHLVGDIHQPLHVGKADDEGGNGFEIENPFNRRQSFMRLHAYWDDLPGAPWLRGPRLLERAENLLDGFASPPQGSVRQWRDESHALLPLVYPKENGSLLPLVSEEFHLRSRQIANQRVTTAGVRLARLLDTVCRVPRETR